MGLSCPASAPALPYPAAGRNLHQHTTSYHRMLPEVRKHPQGGLFFTRWYQDHGLILIMERRQRSDDISVPAWLAAMRRAWSARDQYDGHSCPSISVWLTDWLANCRRARVKSHAVAVAVAAWGEDRIPLGSGGGADRQTGVSVVLKGLRPPSCRCSTACPASG